MATNKPDLSKVLHPETTVQYVGARCHDWLKMVLSDLTNASDPMDREYFSGEASAYENVLYLLKEAPKNMELMPKDNPFWTSDVLPAGPRPLLNFRNVIQITGLVVGVYATVKYPKETT